MCTTSVALPVNVNKHVDLHFKVLVSKVPERDTLPENDISQPFLTDVVFGELVLSTETKKNFL